MTPFKPVAMPAVATDENFAEVGMAAWIAEHGGTDATYPRGDEDYGRWIGDVQHGSRTYRLSYNEFDRTIEAVGR